MNGTVPVPFPCCRCGAEVGRFGATKVVPALCDGCDPWQALVPHPWWTRAPDDPPAGKVSLPR